MARRALSSREQLNGIRKALASPRTPRHLKKFLRERRDALIAQLGRKRRLGRKRSPGLLDFLGL